MMKKPAKSIFTFLMFCSLFLAATVVLAGCSSGDKPKPGARIPNVPPSTRGSEPGGRSGPGKAGDFDKRSENSLRVEYAKFCV